MTLFFLQASQEISTGTWWGVGGTVIGGAITVIFNFLTKKSDNKTQVDLNIAQINKAEIIEANKKILELQSQKDEISMALHEVNNKLDKLISMFDLIYPLIEEAISNNPAFKKVVGQFVEEIKNKKTK